MDVTPDHFQVFYDQYPEPPTVHQELLSERRQKYQHIYKALLATPPPSLSSSDQLPDFVPTSIEKAGPGNYGSKQIDDGGEVVLLNDDVLTSVPNATLVLIDGNELERISVLFQFPQFLEHCPVECISVMVPRICTDSIEWSLDAQLAATEALYFVVSREVPHHIAKHIAWAALLMASKTDSPQLFDSCAEIVSMILPQLHRHDVLKLVVPDAVDMAMSNKPHERRLAARVIGSFEQALSREEVQLIFEDTALVLAQDEHDSVRSMMAQSMASLAANLPMSSAEQRIWPVLKMLSSDANANVRAAAMRSLAKSAQAHSGPETTSPLYEALLKPIFLEECSTAGRVAASDLRDVDDDTYLILEIFSEVYGHFLCSLSHLLNNEQESWTLILNTLRQMVTCNGPTVRHWCAFNMPAVVTVCADERVEHLNGVIPALAGDSDVETRVTLAAGIHEIAKRLANGPLRGDVIRATNRLFMDENPQVRMKVLAHFSELLLLLSPGEKANHAVAMAQIKAAEVAGRATKNNKANRNENGSSRAQGKSEPYEEEMRRLKPMFTALEQMSFDSWRTQKLLADELRKSANLVPQEMLCEHVAPLLFQMARESTFLVRKSAMHALVYTVRYIPDARKRNHILKHFRQEWAKGKVYWTRLAYIEAAGCAKEVFSSRLFTELFKDDILAMYGDLVPNVRLRLIRFFRYVAPIWKELPEFQESLSRLTSDKDSEVSREAYLLLRSLSSIKRPSAIEVEKDKALEVAESAFYVHRSKKKRKVHQRSGEQHGIYEVKSGRAAPNSFRDEPKQLNRSSNSAQPQPQQKKSIREEPVSTSRKSGPPGADIQNTRIADKRVQSVPRASSTEEDSGKKQVRQGRQHSKTASGQPSPSRPLNGHPNNKKVGFFSKLLSSCFGT
ncbi:Serine/threonine-protein phosphatase 4 regulatory subunit 4 [Gracilariopsis chorda]|uniref:Serine/threonine-protein phosphatase 4 regulatory subunit 4 n=1 Tax=Gracilariopsis chorda TaxID=448386 RepID=A0A2V3J2F2_9FLOR|nr:Serine/threonine-protein phosphatase 4 regulatory subunit 4 [Gracilariopsis chorda]|eukprot:PXF48554.1 Serine/threonine-protein phosphatase 4 regulatory subunit 4 [Gracilariopsis chorda]